MSSRNNLIKKFLCITENGARVKSISFWRWHHHRKFQQQPQLWKMAIFLFDSVSTIFGKKPKAKRLVKGRVYFASSRWNTDVAETSPTGHKSAPSNLITVSVNREIRMLFTSNKRWQYEKKKENFCHKRKKNVTSTVSERTAHDPTFPSTFRR